MNKKDLELKVNGLVLMRYLEMNKKDLELKVNGLDLWNNILVVAVIVLAASVVFLQYELYDLEKEDDFTFNIAKGNYDLFVLLEEKVDSLGALTSQDVELIVSESQASTLNIVKGNLDLLWDELELQDNALSSHIVGESMINNYIATVDTNETWSIEEIVQQENPLVVMTGKGSKTVVKRFGGGL